jgi:hypothetical protein
MKRTLLLAPLFWWAACSSSGGGGPSLDADLPTRGGGDGPVAASGCEDAIALCTKLNECAPFLIQAIYGNVAGCADRITSLCTEQAGSPGSGMTAGNLAACKAALQTATCIDVFSNSLPACSFRGTLADGSTCGDHSQCASAFCSTGGNLCGICAPKQANGGACPSGGNDECQSGLVCGSGKTCVAPGVLGGPCDDKTQPCMGGTFCTTAKTCALTVQAGQNCPGGYLSLADGTYCTGKDVPAAQIATAAVGKECGLAPGAGLPATLCAPGGVAACTPLADSINLLGVPTHGQCAALADDGFTCAASALCQAGAQCIAGTCQIPSGKYCP